MLLISGGRDDFNLTHIADVCVDLNVLAFTLYLDADTPWAIDWSIGEPALNINGTALTPTAAFVRWDVFSLQNEQTSLTSNDLNNWFDFIKGWALSNNSVHLLNQNYDDHFANKPLVLKHAQQCGLTIPETLFATHPTALSHNHDTYIYKPIAGGTYTKSLSETADLPSPQILQEKLINPELRIYRIGDEWFGFEINSDALDYRALAPDAVDIKCVTPPPHLVNGLKKLTDLLKLEYSAADFKTCPKTGTYKFLEINSMPMIAGLDVKANGALSHALLKHLVPEQIKSRKQIHFMSAST